MKKPVFFWLAAMSLLFSNCKKENNQGPPTTVGFTCEEQPAVCNLTAANGDFAIAVFQQINGEEPAGQNIFVSPFSMSTALTMTANGAATQTLDDMRQTLKVGNMDMASLNTGYKTLLETLPNLDQGTKLKLANSLWPQVGYPVLQSFLETNTTHFNSEVLPVDFKNTATVIDQVNGWVEGKTDGLIQETLSELPADAVLLLINAIYFKGAWKTEFDPEDTHQASFTTPAGPVEVDMMHLPENDFPYFSNDLFQAIDLPYGDSVFSMSIFLPKEGHDLNEVIAEMDPASWATWLSAFQTQPVQLFLPKFKLEYGIKMKKTLSDMGMGLSFSDAADFSNMIDGGGVKIDEVIHKAFVEVNEQGTEAAAVTVVVIMDTAAGILPTVNVNHPFLFVIRDNKTNSILFMGKVVNPAG